MSQRRPWTRWTDVVPSSKSQGSPGVSSTTGQVSSDIVHGQETQPSQQPSDNSEESASDQDHELVTVIDETGEGWGFDLEPGTVLKPLALTSAALFGFGMLAGIPAGIALGRSEEGTMSERHGSHKPRPTPAGMLFAFRAFLYGTLLCGTCGAAAVYATARYYDTWTWKEFGDVMRTVVPRKRKTIENALTPCLDFVRRGAAETLPGPTARARESFAESRIGAFIKSRIEISSTVTEETDQDGDQIISKRPES